MATQFVPIQVTVEFREYLKKIKGELSYEKYIKSQFDMLLELQEMRLSELRDENWQRPDDILKDNSASGKTHKHTDGKKPHGLGMEF